MQYPHTLRRLAVLTLAAAGAALPLASHAESSFQTGAGALTANARLDFRVTIPKVLFLQIGTGTNLGNNTTVDLVDFTVTAANVGNGTPVTGSAPVTAKVIGNGGNVTLTSGNGGALLNGPAGETISFADITASTSNPTLPSPALVDSGVGTVTLTAAAKVVNQTATWTYSYANTATPAAGTYGGVNTNNSRVTYTASMP